MNDNLTNMRRQWGDNVRNRRQTLGLSQDDLACRVGVTQATISRVENGSPVTDAMKERVSEALECSPFELFPLS